MMDDDQKRQWLAATVGRVCSDDVMTSMPTAASAVKGHTREPDTSAAHARACDVMDCCGGDGVVVVGRATCVGVHVDRRATGTAAPAWVATCTLVAYTGGIALQISNEVLYLSISPVNTRTFLRQKIVHTVYSKRLTNSSISSNVHLYFNLT